MGNTTKKSMTDFNKFGESWPCINPLGYYRSFLLGRNRDKSVIVDLFDDHRLMFFSILSNRRTKSPLNLVSIDYHLDLAQPSKSEKANLSKLDLESEKEVAFFVWHHLNPLNDNHILSAAYLNLISDIIILTKDRDPKCSEYRDKDGNKHNVHSYNDYNRFIENVELVEDNIFLDIDLDYFVKKSRDSNDNEIIKYVLKEKDYAIFNKRGRLMRHCKDKLEMVTIAREPEHCGGVLNSNAILSRICSKLFHGSIAGGCRPRPCLKIYS